ncbi:MAG: hypothetical protein KJ000_28200, partial [Pirellulaceae bacterium]|nr:hypothetical protein [Pirellulaceae bacterium]
GSGANPANAADFGGTLPSGQVSFAAGETSKTVTVNISGDTVVESDEGFTVTLSAASGGATITTATASGTIRNDDIALAISAADANKFEGNSGTTPFTFTVTRTGLTTGTTTANWAVTGSGANPANAADFGGTLPSGQVSFAAGETSKSVTVNVSGDVQLESDEGFTVTLSNASGGATITTATASGTIRNDDPGISIVALAADKFEGQSGTTPFTFTVSRPGATSVVTTVNYAVTGIGANPANAADFGGTLPSGQITFAPGETSKTLTVDISGDALVEPDEGFTVTLSYDSGGGQTVTTTASGTIRNDDIRLDITAADANKFEGNTGTTPFTFTVTRTGLTTGTTTANWAVTGSGANPANAADFGGTLPSGQVSFAAGETSKTVTVNVSGDLQFESDEGFTVALSNASGGAQIGTAAASGTIRNDDSATFVVTALTPTDSGFVADFSAPLNPSFLNLHNDAGGGRGAADISFVGATTGTIRGSVVLRADNRQLTFIKTGEPLAPDSYTVTLRSAADGFVDSTGRLLDGNANGVAGDDFVNGFVVAPRAANEVTVSIPDFVRGFGQSVNLPDENSVGIPVTLSTGQNVAAVDLDFVFDPALLNVGSFTNSVAGASSSFNLIEPGRMRITVSSVTEFGSTSGPIELGRFLANVPATAPYAVKQVLRLENVLVENTVPQSRPSRADQGLHIVAFVGDGNASRTYTGGDATLQQRLIVGQNQGFAAYPLADPLLIADVNSSGTLTGGDSTLLQRLIVGTPITQAPPLPTGISPPDIAGPDPRLFIPIDLTGGPGETVTIPVTLEVTEAAGISVAAIDLAIAYDPAVFTVSNFARGALLDGFGFTAPVVNSSTPGILRVTMSSAAGPELAFGVSGVVFQFDATVAAETPEGVTRINLLQNSGVTFTGIENNDIEQLTLVPAPTNADNDPVDGVFTIADPVAELSIVAADADRPEGNSGTTPFTFTVTRAGLTTGTTIVDYTVTGSGASPANAADFGGSLPSGQITFAPDETSKTLIINVSGDTLVESDEGFTVTLSDASGGALITTPAASGTIRNDDTEVTLNVVPAAVQEDGGTPLVFTFAREGVTSESLTVSFTVAGTAAFSDDYSQTGAASFSSTAGTVTFAAGSTTAEVLVHPIADSAIELDETVVLSLVGGAAYTVGQPGAATGTIVDDDRPCVFIEDPQPMFEGDAGTQSLIFTVRLCLPLATELSVDYATRDGSATAADSDYQSVSGTLVFRPGEPLSQTIAVPVLGDQRVETDEDFFVDLSNLVTADPDAIVTRDSARGVILNDDTEVHVLVAPQSVVEDGNESLIFTLTRSGVTSGELTVEFQVGGSATFSTDYTVTGAASFSFDAGTVTFSAGSTTATVTIDPVADETVEDDETIVLTLVPGSGYTVADPATATGTILNDDTDVSITVSPAAVFEDSGLGLVYTITRTGVVDRLLTVHFSVTGDAGFDHDYSVIGATTFSASAGSVQFAADQTTASLTVQPVADDLVELDETVVLTLLPGSDYRPVQPSSATGTIENDDEILWIAAADAVKVEGNSGSTILTFTVTREGYLANEVTVSYAVTGSGSHPADANDFGGSLPGGQLTFAAGQASQTIEIPVSGDTAPESHEGFTVTLSNASGGAQIVIPQAQGTILNDDVRLAIAPADAVKFEGAAGSNTEYTFTVTRTGMTTEDLTVSYAVSGSGGQPADAVDFGGTFPSGLLTFADDAPLESVQTITVLVTGDNELEPDEGFTVTLSNASGGAQITAATAEGLIQNDDQEIGITAADSVRLEGNAGNTEFTFTVTRAGFTGNAALASYAVTGSGANPANAADFGGTLPAGQVTFAAGETTRTITILVTGDTELEADEQFTVSLSTPSDNAQITVGSAVGTIRNDDAVLRIAATDAAKFEGDTGTTDFTFTVTREGYLANEVTVSYAVTGSGSDPADANDFGGALPSGQVMFTAGEATRTIVIPVAGDTVAEPNEGFTVTLSGATQGVQIVAATAVGTILNDDTIIRLSVSPASVPEDAGQLLRYTFTREGQTGSPLTVSFSVGGTATLGADYGQTGAATFTSTTGTVLLPAGASTATVTIAPLTDRVTELNETVVLTLTPGSGYRVDGPAAATGTIVDDDAAILSIEDGTLLEPETGSQDLVLQIRMRDGQGAPATADVAVSVNWTFTHKTTNDSDFASSLIKSGTVTIPAGQSGAELRFPVVADNLVELDETFEVTLNNLTAGNPSRNVQLGRATAVGTIQDDPLTAELRGFVYSDSNNNGQRDAASEKGIPGVIVTLTGTDSSGNAVQLVAMTDDQGAYGFINLQAGTYEIRESQSGALLDGPEQIGSQQGQVADDRFYNIVLAPAAKGEGYNFGERGWRAAYITQRMFLASTPSTPEALRQRLAAVEEKNGNTQLAEQIRNASIPSVVSANPAGAAATNSSAAAANQSAALTSQATGGEGEAAEPSTQAARLAQPTADAVGAAAAADFVWTQPASEPPSFEPTTAWIESVLAQAEAEPAQPEPEPVTPDTAAELVAAMAYFAEPAATLLEVPAEAASAVKTHEAMPSADLETFYELLAWEAANAESAQQAAEFESAVDSSTAESLADKPEVPDAQSIDAIPVGEAVSAEPASNSDTELDAGFVDALFEWDEPLLELRD